MVATFPNVGDKIRVREGKCIERFPSFIIEGGTGTVKTSEPGSAFICVAMDNNDELHASDDARESLFNEWSGEAHFSNVPGESGTIATAAEDFHDCMEVIQESKNMERTIDVMLAYATDRGLSDADVIVNLCEVIDDMVQQDRISFENVVSRIAQKVGPKK
jgi:hypothetical protein